MYALNTDRWLNTSRVRHSHQPHCLTKARVKLAEQPFSQRTADNGAPLGTIAITSQHKTCLVPAAGCCGEQQHA
jgi:hypothetical protein